MKIMKLCFMLLLAIALSQGFDMSTQAREKVYTFNSFGSLIYGGYAIGQSSGDSYFMMSDDTNSHCALIRETLAGTEVWAKLYTRGICTGLAVDSSETYAYFSDYRDSTNTLSLTQVNCGDGSTNQYYTSSNFEVDDSILSISISNTGNTLYMAGSLDNTTSEVNNLCKWTLSTTDLMCNEWNSYAENDVLDVYSNSDTWLYITVRDSGNVYRPSMINISDSTVTWTKAITDGTAAGNLNAYSDYDGTNLHIGIPFTTVGYGLFVILEQSTGNVVNSMKQVTSSNTLIIASVTVDSNMKTAIVSCQFASPFNCEFIHYDKSSDTFTNYMITPAVINHFVSNLKTIQIFTTCILESFDFVSLEKVFSYCHSYIGCACKQ